MNIFKAIGQKVFGVAKAEEVKMAAVTKDKLSPAMRHIQNFRQAGAFGGSRLVSNRKDQKAKGKSGSKLMRKAMRKYGVHNVLLAIGGADRGKRMHPGYPKMGAKVTKKYTMEATK